MTCIVGLVDNGKVYMGGDRAGANGSYNLRIINGSKVFIKEGFIMGYTTSFRMGQLLEYKFWPPDNYIEEEIHRYMCTSFVDGVKKLFKDEGFAHVENNEESGGSFLVGHKGRLFMVLDYYQVIEPSNRMAAVGCGADIALGSLYSTTGDPKERILKALSAAEEFSAGVRGPFDIIELEE